jgi:hypothetical protein
MDNSFLDYAIVAILGALVGGGELISRYRDAPARAVYNWPAFVYIALNVAASLVALAIIRIYGWKFGVSGGETAIRWAQVGIAGTGAMALFRTSLFTIHAGDKDIGVGPSSFLQIFRDASDRAVDRLRAKARGEQVSQVMTGIAYDKAAEGLALYCLALMQNVPSEEQVKLTQSLELLDKEQIDPAIKVRVLGLNLMNVVGPNVLIAAVDSLREQMETPDGGKT